MTSDLTYFLADLLGLAIASVIAVPMMLAPGAIAARLLHGLRPATDWRAFSPALSIAFLPVILALSLRALSPGAAVVLDLVLVAAALMWARAWLPRVGLVAAAGAVVWWLYLAAMYVDFDFSGALYQSVTVLDLVKHAAVVREIAAHGLPLSDPFFARPEAAGYYHYFYDEAALVDLVGGRLVDARMAFCGAAFACGLAMASLLRAFVVELGLQRCSDRRLTALVVVACAIGGLDLVGIAFRWAVSGALERTPEWWDEEISFFPTTASWVPHHLAGVIASFVALLLMAKAIAGTRREGAWLAAAAGIAMASAFGLSVWVCLGAACVFALALRFLAAGQRLPWLASAAVAAAVALVLSLAQLHDLAQGRSGGGLPVWLWIREPARLGELLGAPLNPLVALLLTPLVLALEFGAFAVASTVFMRQETFAPARHTALARVLFAAAVAGLLLNLLVRSTIINNDFGWRVAWFAELPAMIATVAVLQRRQPHRALRAVLAGCIALGFASTLYAVVAGRAPPAALPPSSMRYINAGPETDLALRRAYLWANRHLPAGAVLQHNPAAARRAFDFGLYSRNPVRVADFEGELFGAPHEAVEARALYYGAIFAGRRPIADAGAVHLVVTDRDPLWRTLDPRQCLYRAPHVCITRGTAP